MARDQTGLFQPTMEAAVPRVSCPHFCDCAECLNIGGGYKYEGAGIVHQVSQPIPKFALAHQRAEKRRYLAKLRARLTAT